MRCVDSRPKARLHGNPLPFMVADQDSVSGMIGLSSEHPILVSNNFVVANPTVGVNDQFLNAASFALPASYTLGNAAFGKITTLIGDLRDLQMALKLQF